MGAVEQGRNVGCVAERLNGKWKCRGLRLGGCD